MTTTVKIQVNGRYRTTVRQDDRPPVVIEGNYEGSSNPTGLGTFSISHTEEKGSQSEFVITEEYIPEEAPKPEPAAAAE